MDDHPEKAEKYRSSNVVKVNEIDTIISSISLQIQEVQQDVSKFNSMSTEVSTVEDDDEALKEEEYNKLAGNINSLLTDLDNSKDKFSKLKREFDKKLKEISNNVEDE
jgi:predicted RNase H-like nuclease (RuvC/YqgF family)